MIICLLTEEIDCEHIQPHRHKYLYNTCSSIQLCNRTPVIAGKYVMTAVEY